MNRCPTCKTEARTGAKFCTFCGTPLEPAADAVVPSSDQGGFDREIGVADPVGSASSLPDRPSKPAGEDEALAAWPIAPTADATEAPSDHVASETTTWPTTGDTPVEPPTPSPFPTWGPPLAAAADDPAAAAAGGGGIEAPLSVAADAAPSEWRVVAIHQGVEPDREPTVGDIDGAERHPAEPLAFPQRSVAEPDRLEEVASAAAFTSTPEASALVVVPRPVGAAVPAPNDAGRRAAELLDELRTLLPALGATRLPAGAIADGLDAAVERDGGVPDGLRSAMEEARANPRDIDTVLEVTRRIDDVIALIDRHDRLADAARSAAQDLRAGRNG